MPIPEEHGEYVFGRSLSDFPDVVTALTTAGLYRPPAPRPWPPLRGWPRAGAAL